MGKLIAVIKREYLERVRTRWFAVATLFGPVLLVAITVLPAYLAKRSTSSADVSNIAILDVTASDLGQRIATNLASGIGGDTSLARVLHVMPESLVSAEASVTRDVIAKRMRGYLVVDQQTMQGTRARYAGRNASTLPDLQRIQGAVERGVLAMRLERAGLDLNRVQQMTRIKLRFDTERITDKGRGGSGELSIWFAFGAAFLLYVMIVLYGQTILRGVVDEKTSRVAEVVVASVSPETLLAGKVIGVGAVGLTQQIIWAVSAVILIKERQPIMSRLGIPSAPLQMPDISFGVAIVLVLFFVLGFTFYSSLFAAVGSMVNNDQDAQQAATPVILLIVVSIVFLQPVILNPTGSLSVALSRIPFSAPIIMPVRMSLVPVSWIEMSVVIVGLLLACAAAVWVASRIYRVGLLMYGKKPSLAELSRWVRYSR